MKFMVIQVENQVDVPFVAEDTVVVTKDTVTVTGKFLTSTSAMADPPPLEGVFLIKEYRPPSP